MSPAPDFPEKVCAVMIQGHGERHTGSFLGMRGEEERREGERIFFSSTEPNLAYLSAEPSIHASWSCMFLQA